jgi:O-antigen/teichoic acid export membrane protein
MTNQPAEQDREPQPYLVPEWDEFFGTEHITADLKYHSVRGGIATMATQFVKLCLQIGSVAVLARLLEIEDFGLVAMITAIIAFATIFKDIGLSTATIQTHDINHHQVSTLFWINAAIGFVIMLLIAACAPAIALFYGEPRLTTVTLVLATVFFIGGLGVQQQALLRRQMRFGILGVIEISSLTIGIGIAIISGLYGARYWALVLMQVATAISNTIGTWLVCKWRPGFLIKLSTIRSLLTFGGHLTGFNIVNYLARNMDKILIGRYWNSLVLGLYDRAYQIVLLPMASIRTPLLNVAIPALSRLQDDPGRYRNYYTRLISLLSMISMPLMVFCFFCSRSIILLIFGEKWIEANSIFKMLALVGFIEPVAGTRGSVLISLGQSARCLRWGILNSIAMITAFIIGIRWGALGVATCYAMAIYSILLPSLWYCFRFSPLNVGHFLSAVWRPVIASFVMGLAIFSSLSFVTGQAPIIKIIICSIIGFIVYMLMWLVLPDGLAWIREMYRCFLLAFGKQNKAVTKT